MFRHKNLSGHTPNQAPGKHSNFVDTPENVGIIKVHKTEVSIGHQFKRKS